MYNRCIHNVKIFLGPRKNLYMKRKKSIGEHVYEEIQG